MRMLACLLRAVLIVATFYEAAAIVEPIEPTPYDEGLFGPPFSIPLLEASSGAVAADLKIKLAVSPEEQHHGLMFKQSMGQDEGMLFLYTSPSRRVLWMKNTPMPLDAAWFTGDGLLREVYYLKPYDLTYRWTDRIDIVMGLELSGGWFERHGLHPDAVKIDKQALAAALKARGYDPKPFIEAGSPRKEVEVEAHVKAELQQSMKDMEKGRESRTSSFLQRRK